MKDDKFNLPKDKIEGKYMGSVKVGPKGQIVIPKEARDLFGIQPGDTLVLLADAERGIAIQGHDLFQKFYDQAFGYKPEES